ncbi:hypothetical protein SVAN01_05582 [Stagonosporopsis vannaccii]|nr:hypothetical protein SVAN01_05582 [Stagonosporopsis vannaccii]
MGNAAVLSWQHIGRHSHPFDQFTGFIRRRPTQDLAGLFGVLQPLRPWVSGDYLAIWKLIPYGIQLSWCYGGRSSLLSIMIFVSTTLNTLDAEHRSTGQFPDDHWFYGATLH